MWPSGQCFTGVQRQRTSCSAAPSRAATQAGTRAATRQQPSQSAQTELVIEHQSRRHVRLADGAGTGTVGAQSAGVDGVHVCLSHANPGAVSGAAAMSASHQQPALLPSAIDGIAEQSTVCFTAGGHANGHTHSQLQSAALHHHAQHAQQPHHHRRPSDSVKEEDHFHPQLGRGATAGSRGAGRNANGSSSDTGQGHVNGVRLQLFQQHAAALKPDCPSTASNGGTQGHTNLAQVQGAELATCAASSEARILHHGATSHIDVWVNGRSRHSGPDHGTGSGSNGPDGMLMPFLDAASRSSGVASTSGVDRGGRYGGPHARGAASGRSPASASNRLLSTVAAAAASTAATAAGPGAGAGAASPVPLELAERVAAAAVDAVSQPGWMPRGAGSGKGSSSSSSSSSNSSLEVAGGGASREGNGTGRGAGADLAPWHPDAELLPPSTLQQLPEGDEHYTVADDAEDMDGDEEDDDDGADRRGRRRRGRRSSNSEASNLDPLDAPLPRRPRHPSRAEHRMLRQQAAVHQLALRPRAPAPEDLRLTSRIMTCTHWSQLLPLLADHAEAHDRRQRQQHHPQGGKGSRAQSPGARSSGSSSRSSSESGSANGKAAAGLNVLAAAAAAAASGHVPMAALPYTPQHVAAALQRTAQLVEHGAGPGSAADARRLHGLVDCLARLAAALLPSPGMGLREVTSVFHSLVRLRHPVGKPYYIALMTTARQRFSAAAAATALPAAGAAASPASAGAAGAAADASGSRTGAAAAGAAHDLSLLIWCVAACGMSGLRADWAAAYSAALQPVATSLAPQGVAMALYGLARLRSPPPPALLADLCGQLVQHMEAAGAALEGASVDGSEWEAVKACASRCAEEERQRVWWQQQQQQQLTGAAGPSGVEASPNGTNGVDHNAGGNGNGTSSSSSSSSSSSTGGQCRPVDVSLSLWALATLRLPPGGFCPRLLPAAERYSLAHLPDFPQQELSNLMWALARLQHRPSPAFMARLYDTTWVLLPELQPQALSTLLYSLAQMGAAPEQAWLAAAAGCAAEALPGFAPQSMALTVYALAVLGYRPQDSWLQTFHSQLEAQRGGVDTRVRDKVREAYRIMAFRPAGAGGAGAAGAEPHGARGSSSGGAGGAASGTRRGGAAAGSGTGTAPGLRAAPSRWQATAAADRAPSQPAARRAGRPDVRQSPATAATGGAQQADAAAGAALEAEPGEADVSLPHQAEDAASPAVSVLVRPSRFGF